MGVIEETVTYRSRRDADYAVVFSSRATRTALLCYVVVVHSGVPHCNWAGGAVSLVGKQEDPRGCEFFLKNMGEKRKGNKDSVIKGEKECGNHENRHVEEVGKEQMQGKF